MARKKTIKEELNQILKDYGLVEGEPLEIDVVDKILNLFKERLDGLKIEEINPDEQPNFLKKINIIAGHIAGYNQAVSEFNQKIDKLIEELK